MQQVLHRGAAMMQHREEALDASWDDLKLFLAGDSPLPTEFEHWKGPLSPEY